MRWIMIDRFVEIDKGRYAKAVKNITMGEDHIHDQYPAFPVMPQTLIIECMAQAGGILAGYSLNFRRQIFLAKIEKASFNKLVRPGDQLVLQAWIDDLREEGCRVRSSASVNGKEIGKANIMFVGLENPNGSAGESKDFIFAKDLLRIMNIDVDSLDD